MNIPNPILLLIVGIVCLVVAAYVTAPPPVRTILNVVGWICVAVGAVLILARLLGVT